MKRYYTIASLFLAAAMTFSACEKDENGFVSLNVEVDNYTGAGNTKMYIDEDNYTHWTTGDQVKLYYYSGSNKNTNCSVDLSGEKAKITGVPSSTDGYMAVYPASIAGSYSTYSGTISVTLPATQTYSEDGSGRQIINAPMCAYCADGSTSLTFHNLCSLIKVTIDNDRDEEITMQSITVSSNNRNLSGSGTIKNPRTDAPSLEMSYANKYVTLDFSSASETISQGGNKTYYIVVPSFTTTSITISVEAYGSNLLEKKLSHSSSVLDANVLAQGPSIEMSGASVVFEGLGTEEHPFLINNLSDMNTLKERVSAGNQFEGKYFRLENNIDCGSWSGIGSTSQLFKGIFNGNNNKITYSLTNSGSYNGLFRCAGSATIMNLKVNCIINNANAASSSGYCGGIVGYSYGTIFQNCEASGSISGSGKYYGGITGRCMSSYAITISNCSSSVTVTSTISGAAYLGGIVGSVEKTGSLVEDCTASGDVTAANGTAVGGIVGSLSSGCSINNCTYTGTTSGQPIVGVKSGFVTNCTPTDQND